MEESILPFQKTLTALKHQEHQDKNEVVLNAVAENYGDLYITSALQRTKVLEDVDFNPSDKKDPVWKIISASCQKGYTKVACRYGREETAKYLINQKANVNAKDSYERTPLMEHLMRKEISPSMVKLLLDNGASLTDRDCNDVSVLCRAAEVGDYQIFRLLTDCGLDVLSEENILFEACKSKGSDRDKIVKYILNAGYDVNVKDDRGMTALHFVVLEGHLETLKILLREGADLNACANEYGTTPLVSACSDGFSEVAEELIKNGAKVVEQNDGGPATSKALHEACLHNKFEIVRLLMKHTPDLAVVCTAHNSDHLAPLQVVCIWSHYNLLEYFLSLGIDPNTQFHNRTLLEICLASRNSRMAMLVIRRGASLEGNTTTDGTLLEMACSQACTDIVAHMLDNGVQLTDEVSTLLTVVRNGNLSTLKVLMKKLRIDAKFEMGETLFFEACKEGWLDIVEYLCLKGVDINKRHTKKKNYVQCTPLSIAALHTRSWIVDFLIKQGCNVNDGDSLYWASCAVEESSLSKSICENLIKHGANVQEVNYFGYTPLAGVCRTENIEIAEILLDAGAYLDFSPDLVSQSRLAVQKLCESTRAGTAEILREILQRKAFFIPTSSLIKSGTFNIYGREDHLKYANPERLQMLYMADLYEPLLSSTGIVSREGDLSKISEEWRSFLSWLDKEVTTPKSLKRFSRQIIRNGMGFHVEKRYHELPLPTLLQKYLLIPELDGPKESDEEDFGLALLSDIET